MNHRFLSADMEDPAEGQVEPPRTWGRYAGEQYEELCCRAIFGGGFPSAASGRGEAGVQAVKASSGLPPTGGEQPCWGSWRAAVGQQACRDGSSFPSLNIQRVDKMMSFFWRLIVSHLLAPCLVWGEGNGGGKQCRWSASPLTQKVTVFPLALGILGVWRSLGYLCFCAFKL